MKTKCPDCCYPTLRDNRVCGCCEGTDIATPLSTANRPGLSKLRYRIGTHGDFLETMLAMLSSSDYPELAALTTRESDDPSIAMLDAWATVADVLTFYQERIANEGYLRTATERRSILELARLVGYRLRPGVASSVYLAYTIDKNMEEDAAIPVGSRVQSVPAPGELPQSFETSEELKARAAWNNLQPRMTQPQTPRTINTGRVYLKGITTNLKPNDPLLIDYGISTMEFYRVTEVTVDANANRTLVKFRSPESTPTSNGTVYKQINTIKFIKDLMLAPSLQPRNTLTMTRNLSKQFSMISSQENTSSTTEFHGELASSDDKAPSLAASGASFRSAVSFFPLMRKTLPLAVSHAKVTDESAIKVYALRINASLFGHNALREPQYEPKTIPNGEFDIQNPNSGNLKPQPWPEWKPDSESGNVMYLDKKYDQLLPETVIVVQSTNDYKILTADKVNCISRNAYGISGEITQLTLKSQWWDPAKKADISEIRTTKIYAQPETLELAEEPVEELVCGGTEKPLELDGFYDGLESGRWVIVSGERNIEGTSGIRFSELAMLSSVEQKFNEKLPGDKIHTFITLAKELAYCFKRDTVTINGNVVKATHGETRKEVLGSGDGSKALQSFGLKLFPLTYVSASNPAGVDSTLQVFVNDMACHEADSLAGLEAADRKFITKTDNDDKTTITFGNGREGARLPSGIENIKAEYRNGIGKAGNVKAEQISQVVTKPLGVKEVINPLRASGGADRENQESARKNTPLAVKALDRLVSVQDYEDFSRVYAGIGKARAVEISDGRRQIVHVTIAGADDIPIDTSSDLFLNLRKALSDFGDPFQPIMLEVRELMLIVISANIKLLPDYQWEPVVTELRSRLLEAFGFERRELGQDVLLSEVISVMQNVRGVAYVDVDTFGGIPEKINDETKDLPSRRLLTPDEIGENVQSLIVNTLESNKIKTRLSVNLADFESGMIRTAQLAFLSPEVPETLILNKID
jgi:hypothetical protein